MGKKNDPKDLKSESINSESEITDDAFESIVDDLSSLKVPTADELNQKEGSSLDKISKLEQEAKESYQKYLYAMAEIDNMKKRHLKERSDLLKYNGENIARDIIEVLDDLERTSEQSEEVSSSTLLEGITLIASRMRSLLERHQIKSEDSLGAKFDPNKHEAITMSPSKDAEPGTIIHQVRKTYFFKDKLLRPAQVVVVSEKLADNSAVDAPISVDSD